MSAEERTMRAIVSTGPGTLEWQELPRPEPGRGEVRVRTLACGICATDLEMIAGWQRTGFPAIPGHEWCGVVEAVGAGVTGGLLGARCVAENVLADGGEVGFEHPGGYAEAFLTEAANVRVLPADFDPTVGALIEPLAVCVRGLRRLRVEDTSSALVLGDGPIGLLFMLLLARAGVAQRCLVGGQERRLRLAEELAGAEILNYHDVHGELGNAVVNEFGRRFVNVIEASGSAAAMTAAVELARHCGKVLVVGDYGDSRADFRWNRVLHSELEIIGSNASADAWDEAVEIAMAGELPLEKLVTTRLPVDEYERGIEMVRSSRSEVKVVLLRQ